MYTKASHNESCTGIGAGVFASKCTETKAPGIGGLQGKKRGCPSSRGPVKRLQIGFVPRSGRLFPTRTTIVPGIPSPAIRERVKNLGSVTSRSETKLNHTKRFGNCVPGQFEANLRRSEAGTATPLFAYNDNNFSSSISDT